MFHLTKIVELLSRMDTAETDITALEGDQIPNTTSGLADGDIWQYVSGSSEWQNKTKTAADLVLRSAPALEGTPYIYHETRSQRASGTETIVIGDDPSVYLPIGAGSSVTISLDTPALSLPERGLNDVALFGRVFVKMNGANTLTVTTDAGTKIGTFPKGTGPTASGEWAILAWLYFDDGTTDFIWAEWVNDVA